MFRFPFSTISKLLRQYRCSETNLWIQKKEFRLVLAIQSIYCAVFLNLSTTLRQSDRVTCQRDKRPVHKCFWKLKRIQSAFGLLHRPHKFFLNSEGIVSVNIMRLRSMERDHRIFQSNFSWSRTGSAFWIAHSKLRPCNPLLGTRCLGPGFFGSRWQSAPPG